MAKANQQQQLAMARKEVKEFIQMNEIQPEFMVRIGEMATACLKDKTLYPMLRQQLMASGYFEDDDLTQKYNPTQLAVFSTVGKMTSDMMQTGELGA